MSLLNPYREWLGIPDAITTPNHYRLLGLRLFEDEPAVISAAAERLSRVVNGHMAGPYIMDARRLLAEIESARACLMNSAARASYDASLRQQLTTLPLNPVASAAPDLSDSMLPPTAMSSRGAAPMPLTSGMTSGSAPSSPVPMPPVMPAAPGNWQAHQPPMPPVAGGAPMPPGARPYSPPGAAPLPGGIPSGAAPLPMGGSSQAGYVPQTYVPMPAPPSSFVSGGAPSYAQPQSPSAFAPPPAMPQATPPMAAMAIPVAAPAAIPVATPTPVYSSTPYAAPVAMPAYAAPVAQPPVAATHNAVANSPSHAAADATIVAPNMRLAWQRRKPNTSALVLTGTTAVLIVAAIVVVVANRREAAPPVPKQEVAREPRLFNLPVEPSPRELEEQRSSKPVVKTPSRQEPIRPEPAMDDKPIAMNNAPPTPLPVPAPEPVKPAPVTPAPAPVPAMADPKKDEAVTKALNLARISLGKNDVATARTHIATARTAGAENRADEVDRVDALARYTEDFWKAVREGIKGLVIGGQFAVKDTFVGVVEVLPESLILRVEGQNKTYPIANLPPAIAYALAESWLRKEDAATKIILGTYQAMQPRGDRGKARELWQDAAASGAKVAAEQLLAELNVPLLDPESMPALAEAKPGADGRLPTPGAAAQTQARTEVRQMFEADFADAKDAASKGPLAAKLLERAEQPSDPPAIRYLLLVEASTLAAEAGDFDRMTTALDKLAEHFAVDGIDLKADTLFDAAKTTTGAEANKALAEAALIICDEAVLSDKIDAALKIARTALASARKASDPELVKLCSTREKEVRELKK